MGTVMRVLDFPVPSNSICGTLETLISGYRERCTSHAKTRKSNDNKQCNAIEEASSNNVVESQFEESSREKKCVDDDV